MENSCSLVDGGDIPEGRLRPFEIKGSIPSDQLGRRLKLLAALHPEMIRISDEALGLMDDATKEQLLADMYYAAGIRRLKTKKS